MPEKTETPRYESERECEHSVEARPADQRLDPEWRMQTLAQAVGWETALQFFWKAETDTIQTYEHRLTYRYVHIDSITGQFCNQQRAQISVESALAHALPRPEYSPSASVLAPIVLEPNLQPYVRHISAREEGQSLLKPDTSISPLYGRVKSALAGVYRRLLPKGLNFGVHATAKASVHKLERSADREVNLAVRDVSVAAFTRRAA